MNAAVRAGALCFMCVFAAAFVLGTIRVSFFVEISGTGGRDRVVRANYLRYFAVVSSIGRMLRCIMLAAPGAIR